MDRAPPAMVVATCEKVEAPTFVRMNTWIGGHMPVHCTSVGKALLKETGMKKRTPKTIVVPAKYLHELGRVRELGYSIDDEENDNEVRCLAAPVFDGFGHVIASVGVSGTTGQNDLDHLPRVAELVKEAARRVSREFGA